MENKEQNSDIFEMVNNHERQEAIRRKHSDRRKRNNLKICNWAIISGVISLFFGLLGITGAMIIWVAAPICFGAGMLASFLAGRWLENGKCLGWE